MPPQAVQSTSPCDFVARLPLGECSRSHSLALPIRHGANRLLQACPDAADKLAALHRVTASDMHPCGGKTL